MSKISLQNIYNGGLSQLDDPIISGGSILQLDNLNIVVGDKTNLTLLDMNLEWDSFLKTYWDDITKTEYTKKYIDTITGIFNLPNINDTDQLLQLLKKIYKLNDTQHINGFIKQHSIYKSLSITSKYLYMTWKTHLEELLYLFNDLRTEYIKKFYPNLTSKINNIDELKKKWNEFDKLYNNSSLLLYAFLNKKEWVSKNNNKKHIPKFHLSINKKDKKNKIDYLIKKLKKKIKKNNFTYSGFCQYYPVYRLKELFKFPIKELLKCIKFLQSNVSPHINISKIYNYCIIYDKLTKLNIDEIKKPIPIIKENKRNNPQKQPIINEIKWYVEELLKIYSRLSDQIIEQEKYYIKITKTFNEINKIINN